MRHVVYERTDYELRVWSAWQHEISKPSLDPWIAARWNLASDRSPAAPVARTAAWVVLRGSHADHSITLALRPDHLHCASLRSPGHHVKELQLLLQIISG